MATTALSAVAAAKVNLRPVNRSALRRYQQFWNSLVMLDAAMSTVDTLIAKAEVSKTSYSYRVPASDELARLKKKLERAIHQMIAESKKWEAELVSRDWR